MNGMTDVYKKIATAVCVPLASVILIYIAVTVGVTNV